MICHLSLPAKDPLRVARAIAKVIDGEMMNFPVVKGSIMVVSRDGSGTAIELWPDNVTQHPGEGAPDPDKKHDGNMGHPWDFQLDYEDRQPENLTVHVAVSSKLPVEELLRIGREEGWRCIATDRHVFKLVELWLENRFLLEIISEEAGELEKYRRFTNPDAVAAMFGRVAH